MGKHHKPRSKTLPSSPTHSSSSSDFEFTIALSPRKSSASLCPADELFYKGQLLPLHLSPRISMVRTLLLSSSSTSSSATTTTTARDSSSSTDSSTSSFASDLALLAFGIDNNTQPQSWSASDFNNSRPSSADDADLITKKLLVNTKPPKSYFSRFSNVFKKDNPNPKPADRDPNEVQSGSRPARKPTSSAKDMIRNYYLKKVKPLYEKLSHTATKSPPLQQQQQQQQSSNRSAMATVLEACDGNSNLSQSFSGNLGCPRRTRRSCVASCPSSMRSSPSHSGVLSRARATTATTSFQSDSSTMEELQSAIQGAIAHCKNSMVQTSNKAGISNEI